MSDLRRDLGEERLQLLLRLLQVAEGRLALDRVHPAAEVRMLEDRLHARAVEVVLDEHLLEHCGHRRGAQRLEGSGEGVVSRHPFEVEREEGHHALCRAWMSSTTSLGTSSSA